MHSEEDAKYAKEMREWLNSRPHLPKTVSDNMLCRFVHSCYFDMDKAKEAAETFFTLRRDYPLLFTDRDPSSPHMQNILNSVKMARLELSGKRKLWLYQITDPRSFDMVSEAKLNFLLDDCWFLENEAKYDENDVYYVADVTDIPFKFLWKMRMSVIKVYTKYQREATPIRLKQLHIINSSLVMSRVFSIFKPLLSKEILDSVYFHEPNSDTLLNFFDKDELPADFGGTRPSMDTLMADTVGLIENNRVTALSTNFWVATTSKNNYNLYN